jgi:acyl carrier protein
MVPAAIAILSDPPLSPNGKIDRRALQSMELMAEEEGNARFVPPRNETESALAEVWSGALGKSQVSVTENFFNLGGHSVLAVRVMKAISQRFGIKIPLSVIFEKPTIELLANVVRNATDAPSGDKLQTERMP